jgi:beta-glucosidase
LGNRRNFIASSTAMLSALAWAKPSTTSPSGAFPKGFYWGAATAGHQIEGNNVNSDFWAVEQVNPTLFSVPSGDACNSLELWATDLELAKAMGLNCYRFSIEWSRIEPAQGQFSIAMLDHYKRIVEGCRKRGLTPMVTFNHWTVPIWFAAQGSWTHADSADLFARYCDRVMRHLGDLIGVAFTLNEPNGLLIARAMLPPPVIEVQKAMLAAASRAHGVDHFVGGPAFSEIYDMLPNMLKAHKLGKAAIKAVRGNLPVGATLAVADDQAAGPNSKRDEMRKIFYGAWIDNVKGDDFVGVQNYVRQVWDDKGIVPDPAGVPLSSEGKGIYPSSLAGAVRYVHEATGVPVMVTEHGYYITDDQLRITQLPLALAELKRVIDDGVPVLGYIHWTLIDNFEWVSGFAPKLGLASVDPVTFVRTPKRSAAVFGAIAKRNSL